MAESVSLTPYEEATRTRRLLMLKTFVPYAEKSMQRQLVAMIQLMEYQTVLNVLNQENDRLFACSASDDGSRIRALLSDLKKCCSEGEQEMIDNLFNMICIMGNYEI